MKKIIIGTKGEGFDLQVLLPTRCLIQANSGGGKSYLIRKLAEQLSGKVQIIIIDPEGEFSTLREKFDFVLVGKGGETPADPRSANLLAERLLELQTSAICDIYELKAHDRHRWVRLFLEGLINAPKKLWHPCVIVVDEAHLYAPEKGHGESEASESMSDLATRGRKRGLCAIFATQRLGKLSKNVAAELQNVLIGSTFLDIDRKRAAEILGVNKSDEKRFFDEIKTLEPGNFHALGRAISKERISLVVGKAITSHPTSGTHKVTPPSTPDNIKSLLPKLADLPKEAEEKTKTEKELRAEVAELKKQLKQKDSETKTETKEVFALKDSQITKFEKLFDSLNKKVESHKTEMFVFWEGMSRLSETLTQAFGLIVKSPPPPTPPTIRSLPKIETIKKLIDQGKHPFKESSDTTLGKCERGILNVLAQRGQKSTKNQVAILSGYSSGSGGFNNSLSSLRSKNFITGAGDNLHITESGISALGPYEQLPSGEDLHNYWYRKLAKAEAAILKCLIEGHPGMFTKNDIAHYTGYSVGSGGFNNSLSKLRTLELIEGYSEIKASDSLFL